MSHQPQERHNVCFFALLLTFIPSTECGATLAEFGGSATAEETAGITTATIAASDDSEKGEVTFRESGRIVVGKKGRRPNILLCISNFISIHLKP